MGKVIVKTKNVNVVDKLQLICKGDVMGIDSLKQEVNVNPLFTILVNEEELDKLSDSEKIVIEVQRLPNENVVKKIETRGRPKR